MKLSEWRLKMTENVMEKLDKMKNLGDKVSSKFLHLQDNVNRFKDRLRDAASEIPGLSRAMELIRNPIALIAAGTLAIGTFGAASTRMAFNYEEGMAKVNATAQMTNTELDALKGQLMAIGRDSGGNFDRIPDSFEKILSQVGDVNQSMDILKVATKGAKAGFTDLDVVSSAVAQSLSVIGAENANAQQVMDTFFAAKRVGAGEFGDFAQYVPTLIAAGDNLGMKFQDVAGVFAYMTGKGQEAGSAAMLIQNAFSALGKGEIVKGMDKIGVKVFDKDGTMRDIADIMDDLNGKLGGLSDKAKSSALEKMGLRDVQAKNAISILMSDTNKLREALGATNNSLGETQTALDNTNSPARTWAETMDSIKYIMTNIGYVILPVVNTFLDAFSAALDWLISNKEVVIGFLSGFAIGLVAVAISTGGMSTALAFLTSVVWANTIAWLANPLVWIPLLIAAVVAGFIYLWNTMEGFRGFLYGLWAAIKEIFLAIWEIGVKVFTGLADVIGGIVDFDPARIARGVSSIEDGFKDIGKIGERVGSKFQEGYQKGASEVRARNADDTQSALPNAPMLPGGNGEFSFANNPKADEEKKKSDAKTTEGINSVSGGGSQQRNVVVNINKLNEKIEVRTQTLSEGTGDIERKLTELLLRVVHGGELAIANQ